MIVQASASVRAHLKVHQLSHTIISKSIACSSIASSSSSSASLVHGVLAFGAGALLGASSGILEHA